MGEILQFEAVGYRDILGRFATRQTKLVQGQRRMVRNSAQMMTHLLRFYAPHKTGLFAEGIKYRTDEKAEGTTATFYASGEHGYVLPFLLHGTRAHEIPRGGSAVQLAKGYPLHWVDEATGGHRFAWSVWHPGTQPSPFVENAKTALRPVIRDELMTVARDVIGI